MLKEVLELNDRNILLELPTGSGKSKITLDKIKNLSKNSSNERLLIVVPRNVHKQNWKDEIEKWWPDCNLNIEYTTYVSFPKYAGEWDYIIYDECHHLSERCREQLYAFKARYSLLCSATVGYKLKRIFNIHFKNLRIYSKTLREAIESEILPDPRVYLIPLDLNMKNKTEAIIKNPKGNKTPVRIDYEQKGLIWKKYTVDTPVVISCTERQYVCNLNSEIDYWFRRYNRTKAEFAKNKWLRLCGERLLWLSNRKTGLIKTLIKKLSNYRTLTFCNGIKQTEILGKNCINSKNKKSVSILNDFNNKKIKHITACNMLNEGMNLQDCQVGIYANLNSSNTIVLQRTGRLLRHKNPVIIIPYYKDTREEELVRKMTENYNPDLITIINNIDEIKI